MRPATKQDVFSYCLRGAQNKYLSDDMNLLLKLQGISWLLRRAIILATISLHTIQTEMDNITTITIRNVANGGIQGTTEVRHLDWQQREHKDYIWGRVCGRCGYKLMREVNDESLKTL